MVLLDRLVPVAGDVIHERYELLEELGRGGFGVVYRARQRWLDEDVALKLLLPHVVTNPQLFHRFEREIAVAKRLRHPNSIHILDCGQTDEGLPFYVMEYVTGEPLDEVLKHEVRLSAARTQHIAIQVLKSLGEAHEQAVVHRDLKPGNIMLCQIYGEQDFVKVLDFGIAKALAEPEDRAHRTETGAVLGTPAYMSHEQALGERELDGRSDLYSVGLIMAECLTGQPVVHGDTPFLLLAQHALDRPLPFPDVLRASPLWPIIERATRKTRDLRFPNALEMRRALETLSDLPATPLSMDSSLEPLPPSPYSPGATPPELSTDELIRSSPGFGDGAWMASGSQPLEAPKPQNRKATYLLVVATLLLGILGAALWVRSALDAERPSPVEVPSPSSNTAPSTPSGPEGMALGPTAEELPGGVPDRAVSAPPAGPSDSTHDWPATEAAEAPTVTATATAMAVAADRLRRAVPETHRVRFEGMSGVRVLMDGELLGVTPFDGPFPRVDRAAELRFERDGYRSSTESVSMRDEVVRVELHRRRDDRTPARGEVPVPEPPSPFGQAPIEDRSNSTPFGVTPVD